MRGSLILDEAEFHGAGFMGHMETCQVCSKGGCALVPSTVSNARASGCSCGLQDVVRRFFSVSTSSYVLRGLSYTDHRRVSLIYYSSCSMVQGS